MSHFAEIENGVVKRVLAVEQDYINSGSLGDSSNWVQTSYNTRGGIHYAPNSNTPDGGVALRKNYAGIGGNYDSARDAFYNTSQPYPSWTLNESTCQWDAPSPYPHDGIEYDWNEEGQEWSAIDFS